MTGFSLSWLKREQEELRRDRVAFASALDIMQKRILECKEMELPRTPLLHEWSGTRAVVGSLEMSLHAVERTLEEVSNFIHMIERGEVVNLDAPAPKTPGGVN